MAIRYRGTEGTCEWTIDDNGHLYIGSGIINHNTTGSGSWSWSQYTSEIYSISSGNVSWTEGANACHMFDGCYNLIDLDLSNFDTSNVTNMLSMFEQCNKLKIIDLSNFNTISVSNMATMFASCIDLTDLNISGFNTTNVSNMAGMFYGCVHLTNLDISNFNTSQVTNMQAMFHNCVSLTSLDLSNFDTSSVQTMRNMFYHCNSLISLDVSNFNTSNVTNMQNMFGYCIHLTSLDLSGFDTSNVINMNGMFQECNSLTLLNLSNFDTSNVTDMNGMFVYCNSLTSLDISNFNTSNVINMGSMFFGCTSLSYLELYVNSNPTNYDNIFDSRSYNRQYFIINKKTIDPTTTGTATAEFWSSIAGDYDGVYYEGEGNTPLRVTYSTPTKRYDFEEVSTNVYELVENDSGEWIPVTDLRIILYTDVLPSGWSNSLIAFTCDSSQEVRKADYSLVTANDFNGQNPVTTVYVRVGDQSTLVELTFEDKYEHSTTISFTSNPMFAMIDFMPGGKGMAIGKVANRNGLDVSIPTAIGEGLLLPTVNNTNEIDLTKYQLVVGQYNEQDNDALFIVGSGTSNNPKNLILVKNGMITIGDSDYTYTILDEYGQRFYHNDGNNLLQIANIGYGSAQSEGGGIIDAPYYTFGTRKSATDIYDDTITYKIGDLCIYNDIHYVCQTDIDTPESWTANHWSIIIGGNSHAEGYRTIASNWASHAEGHQSMALGNNSHAEGHLGIDDDDNSHFTIAYGGASHAEGAGTFAKGDASHAEGLLTTASSNFSHAEGYKSTASGSASHAEGYKSTASGSASHAEGYETTASGNFSHVEGEATIAQAEASHAQNWYTIASKRAQTALGRFNIEDTSSSIEGTYALIIGNGMADNARSNALTVDWNGNIVAKGGLTCKTNILMPNSGGTNWNAVTLNASNQFTFGNGSYVNSTGASYFDGNTVTVRSKNNITLTVKNSSTNVYTNGYYSAAGSYSETTSSSSNLHVSSGGKFSRSTASSRKYKTEIAELQTSSINAHNLYKLPVVEFKYKEGYITEEDDTRAHIKVPGFIAEDVAEIYPVAAEYVNGQVEDWSFRYIVPPMLKLIQEQHEEIEQLKKEVQLLKNK